MGDWQPVDACTLFPLKERNLNVYEVESTTLAMRMLARGRVDGAVSTCGQMQASLLEHPEMRWKVIANYVQLSSRNYYMIISRQFVKQYPALSERIWTVSRQISDLHHERLLQRYLGRMDDVTVPETVR